MLSGYTRIASFAFACAGTVCAQTPTLTSIVNAASLAPGICPGAAAIVQGSGFSGDTALSLGGLRVAAVGGSVLPTRFNVLIPATVGPGAYQATVTTAGGTSAALAITVTAASPAFYTA